MSKQYDPRKHHRRSIRLRGWDYGQAGAYFVTLCTHRRAHLFRHAPFYNVVTAAWRAIPTHDHARHVQLDEWVVMPNHMHGIIFLREDAAVSSPVASTADEALRPRGASPGSVGAIIGNFKSLTTRRINNLRRTPGGKVWQRGYYDRIVWNNTALQRIRRYIRNNPRRWAADRENLARLTARMRYNE